jgi:hypothetical protein
MNLTTTYLSLYSDRKLLFSFSILIIIIRRECDALADIDKFSVLRAPVDRFGPLSIEKVR